ncbi:MAG: SdrD B-like domain-containing protein, partial [Saprospiraceae bacterium]
MGHIYKQPLLTSLVGSGKQWTAQHPDAQKFTRAVVILLIHFLLVTNILSAQTFPAAIQQLPKGKKITLTYEATVNQPLNPRTTRSVADQLSVTANGLPNTLSDNPLTTASNDATTTAVLGCTITNITAGTPACAGNNQFTINITVRNDGGAPTTGNLVIEAGGQTFTAPVSANDTLQTINVTLPANGQAVDVRAFYADLPECTLLRTALFTAPVGCGTIGNRVWEDVNGNGIQETGENGIANVTVLLLRCTGDTLAQTLTDASGLYRFSSLAAGEYKLRFNLATAGTNFTNGVLTLRDIGIDTLDSDVDPITRETACLTLPAGQQNLSVDAGVYVPASIGNQVWVDNNRNNIFDGGDSPLAGVTVRLYRCTNTTQPLAAQTTGSNGLYLFSNLAPGSYRLEFTFPPAGIYERVVANIGTDASDSDAGTNGFTDCYTLSSRSQNLSVDAGYTFCPPATTLSCIANVNLTMSPAVCSLKITPDMLLSVAPSCASTFEVRVGLLNGPSFGDVV